MSLLAMAGCGDFVESTDSMGLATVGKSGGELEFQTLSLTVPAGAMAETVTFTVTREPFTGAIGDAYRVAPAGHKFASPVTVRIANDGLSLPPANEIFIADFTHKPPQPLAAKKHDQVETSGTTTVTGIFGLLRCPGGSCPP